MPQFINHVLRVKIIYFIHSDTSFSRRGTVAAEHTDIDDESHACGFDIGASDPPLLPT